MVLSIEGSRPNQESPGLSRLRLDRVQGRALAFLPFPNLPPPPKRPHPRRRVMVGDSRHHIPPALSANRRRNPPALARPPGRTVLPPVAPRRPVALVGGFLGAKTRNRRRICGKRRRATSLPARSHRAASGHDIGQLIHRGSAARPRKAASMWTASKRPKGRARPGPLWRRQAWGDQLHQPIGGDAGGDGGEGGHQEKVPGVEHRHHGRADEQAREGQQHDARPRMRRPGPRGVPAAARWIAPHNASKVSNGSATTYSRSTNP